MGEQVRQRGYAPPNGHRVERLPFPHGAFPGHDRWAGDPPQLVAGGDAQGAAEVLNILGIHPALCGRFRLASQTSSSGKVASAAWGMINTAGVLRDIMRAPLRAVTSDV
jgi:hypothetical protein